MLTQQLALTIFLCFFKPGLHHSSDGKAEERCGHPIGMVAGKIVGGYDVGYYKYPWFVALYKEDMAYCGATLVTKKSVVTAAHCFQHYVNNPKGSEKEYTLKMGTYNICDTHEATLKSYEAKKVYIHEKYKHEDPFYDIALIVLKQDVGFEPACLPSKPIKESDRPKEALIAGYGVLRYQDTKTPCTMMEARVRIYSDTDCKKMLKKADPDTKNFANAFCAGYLEGGVDACQGDSGGPLMVLTSGSRFSLLGLTSFGYKCADKNLLGVYTDVSKFVDWIHEKTNAPITDGSGGSQSEGDESEGDESGGDETEGDESEDDESEGDESDETDEGDGSGEGGSDSEEGDGEDEDQDNDDNDEGDGDKKKKKPHVNLSKRKKSGIKVNGHKKHHGKKHHQNKHHQEKSHQKGAKKSMRTKTMFEIAKMAKKHQKKTSGNHHAKKDLF